MKIGIVTTWFERGAAYVSKQFEEVLSKKHEVFIYARGGEEYAIGDPKWDKENVTWGKKVWLPTVTTPLSKRDFIKWIKKNDIKAVVFNEQHWWEPILWCYEMGIITIAYIDYYKEDTIEFYGIYDYLICNTKRHYETFSWHDGARFIPWGTNTDIFKPKDTLINQKTFFHSAGMSPYRKGTDILIKAFSKSNLKWKLIIHTQTSLKNIKNKDLSVIINDLIERNHLEIIHKSVSAPGLYHMGTVYVYPSRLDGLGLTVAEAMACGLIPILPNNPPMNEFVPNNYNFLIPLDKVFARSDGYYWPIGEANRNDLTQKLNEITKLSDFEIGEMQKQTINFAQNKLSWATNSNYLIELFEEIRNDPQTKNNSKELVKSIYLFSHKGYNKFNNFILRNNFLLKPVVNTLKKLMK